MEASTTALAGMLLLSRAVHADGRGTYEVVWNREDMSASGVTAEFVQDNLIKTRRGTLRGMHFQSRQPQGKLLTVIDGRSTKRPSICVRNRRPSGDGRDSCSSPKKTTASGCHRDSPTDFWR